MESNAIKSDVATINTMMQEDAAQNTQNFNPSANKIEVAPHMRSYVRDGSGVSEGAR